MWFRFIIIEEFLAVGNVSIQGCKKNKFFPSTPTMVEPAGHFISYSSFLDTYAFL